MMCGQCWKKRTVLEKRCIVALAIISIVLIVLIILFSVNYERNYCQTPACIGSAAKFFETVDFNHDSCDNFYEYACGNFPKLAVELGINSILGLQDTINNRRLSKIILEPVGPNDAKSTRLQKQYYQSCINLTAIDEDDDKTFQDLLKRAGGWPVVSGNDWHESEFDLIDFLVTLRKLGLQSDWFLDITIDETDSGSMLKIGIPDGNNKIESDNVQKYLDLMINVTMAFGANENVARQEMKEVLFFENRLADLIAGMKTENSSMNTSVYTIKEVQTMWRKINWIEFLNEITNDTLSDHEKVIFAAKDYLPNLEVLLRTTRKRIQVDYMMWKLVQAYSPLLSKKYRKKMAEYEKSSTGTYPVWYNNRKTHCTGWTKSIFQYALEAAYLRKYVSKSKIKKVHEMVILIKKQMERRLVAAPWLDEDTKNKAILKLENTTFIIGSSEKMYNISEFDRDDVGVDKMEFTSQNIVEISTEVLSKGLDFVYSARHLGQEDFKSTWYYGSVATIDGATYLRDHNTLFIPAGLLQDAFFDESRPNYINYAMVGSIIGHELSHGFDNETTYNEEDWWSNETTKNFHEVARCLENCDGGGIDTFKINCSVTMLENLADYTGVNLAYEAYQDWSAKNGKEPFLPGLNLGSNQIFWLAYAYQMCHVPITEAQYKKVDDTHMLQPHRIIASYRNSPHFGKDFNCPIGSKMNPQTKCQVL